MPVNFQQASEQIHQMGAQAVRLEAELRQMREETMQLFQRMACELDSLEQLIARAAAENDYLRCAQPYHDCLNATFACPTVTDRYALLAADGSQINPDRHEQVEFGAINVGAIRFAPGQPPQESVVSHLMFHDELYTSTGSPLTEDLVALMRDLEERKSLFELAKIELKREPGLPLITLTDGPLELFREAKGVQEFETRFKEYTDVLNDIASLGVATAGYVDKPRSDLIVRLLELVLLEQNHHLSAAGRERPLRGLTDEGLFTTLLQPGERSAVFAIHSGSKQAFQGRLSLHFFYLNVGRENHPYLSRVEIPQWVAESQVLTDLLHCVLLTQARQMGTRAYPYILHRAHEIAVIRFEERDQLETMIVAELYRQGVTVGQRSFKQVAKDTQYRG